MQWFGLLGCMGGECLTAVWRAIENKVAGWIAEIATFYAALCLYCCITDRTYS